MGSFSIELLKAAKTMKVRVEGVFSPEDGKASIEAYHRYISEIHVPDYVIDLDCRGLEVSAPESLPHLGHCFELYKKDGFKKIIFRISGNPILKMQLSSVARTSNLTNFEFIEMPAEQPEIEPKCS
ncbi:hypothetical protein AWM70_02480 [Paenibacillus yonginensis]|uniref:STAS domain-containing protein n=1 Tax=Paenibacillus yonginensis TaxID=1462996 RepID=A0A1B1MWN7_9BACL|nr:hypothetical protein [Paenibacillus yonginensis]ANS73584.1 hypothetical protein AWM70_02480 [Paenibacillus yonginensis]